jgi:uncharacterized membrane protein
MWRVIGATPHAVDPMREILDPDLQLDHDADQIPERDSGLQMGTVLFIATLLAALGSGLMAGLFFAFSTFIMQALGKRPAPAGIAAMQSIDETILNPIFFTVFFGTAVLSVGLAVMALLGLSEPGAPWRLAGALLYLVGSIVVTMLFNVPLNNRLAKVAPDSAEGAAFWQQYLSVWTAWNHARTIGCLGATGSFILGMP